MPDRPQLAPQLRELDDALADRGMPAAARARVEAKLHAEARRRAAISGFRLRWMPAFTFAAGAALVLLVVGLRLSGGSSVRLALAKSEAAVADATADAKGGGDTVMYEAYVPGREFTVGILEGQPLPVVEIVPEHELFDFECKYDAGMAQEIVPAPIPDALRDELQSLALRVHEALRLEHFSRVDFMVDESGTIWCLEANALPGLTGNSLLPKAAAAHGLAFPALCERIARLGMDRGRR